MKITRINAASYADIVRQRDEYDAETDRLKVLKEGNTNKYRAAQRTIRENIANAVLKLIGPTSLNLDVYIDTDWMGDIGGRPGWIISIKNNYYGNNDQRALCWDITIKLNSEGDVVKESNSWSGLKAVTAEQIADLEESVRIIKLIATTDWRELLSTPRANSDDYEDADLNQSIRDREGARPNFEKDMFDAQLEELLNGNTAIELYSNEIYRGDTYILPTRVSEKSVTGYIFPISYTMHNQSIEAITRNFEERRTLKTNLVFKNGAFKTIELD